MDRDEGFARFSEQSTASPTGAPQRALSKLTRVHLAGEILASQGRSQDEVPRRHGRKDRSELRRAQETVPEQVQLRSRVIVLGLKDPHERARDESASASKAN